MVLRRSALAERYRAARRNIRQSVIPGEVSHRHGIREPAIALTFDDGPSEWTEPILDTLRNFGARATFFVIGEAVLNHEDTLLRTFEEGHEIGNHSNSHRHLELLEHPGLIRTDLDAANKEIESVVGTTPRLFRPPFLTRGAGVRRVALEMGFERLVRASIFPRDYLLTTGPALLLEVMQARPRPGSIIVLHDGRPPRELPGDETQPTRDATVAAVRELVPRLTERGYRIVTVSELLTL